ncbi:MAG: MFS transporter, partial [Rhizobiales bacterium]|nr:MFS transporter [Hyphomicrobiales bacterium]
MLALEMQRLTVGVPPSVPARWTNAAKAASSILKQRWAQILLGTTFLEGVLMFGAFAFVGAHLHLRFGIGSGLVGLTIAAFGIGALIYVVSAGTLIRRWGQPKLLKVGSILLAFGYVVLGLTPWLWLAPPAVAIIGLGFYMLHNTLQTEATQLVPEARGLSVSLFAIMLFVGQAVGVVLAGRMLDLWGGASLFLTAAVGMLAIIL